MSEEKSTNNFPKKAAKASAIIPLLIFGIMFIIDSAIKPSSSHIGPLISGLIAILLLLAGIILGVIALCGIKKYGQQGILIPAIIGILLNGALLFLPLITGIIAFKKYAAMGK